MSHEEEAIPYWMEIGLTSDRRNKVNEGNKFAKDKLWYKF